MEKLEELDLDGLNNGTYRDVFVGDEVFRLERYVNGSIGISFYYSTLLGTILITLIDEMKRKGYIIWNVAFDLRQMHFVKEE